MENVDKITAALLNVQAEMTVVRKNKTAKLEKDGRTIVSSRYADLRAVFEVLLPLLAKNGIALLQPPVFRDGVQLCRTILLHSSGQSIEGEFIVRPAREGSREYGSALTFARRYSACSMVGILTDDDDGVAASRLGKGSAIDKVKGKDVISAAERIALKKIWTKAGKTETQVAAYLREAYEVESTAEIQKKDYQEIAAWCAEPKPNAGPADA